MFSAWEMENAGIEESREMYGLFIVAVMDGRDLGRQLAMSAVPRVGARPLTSLLPRPASSYSAAG